MGLLELESVIGRGAKRRDGDSPQEDQLSSERKVSQGWPLQILQPRRGWFSFTGKGSSENFGGLSCLALFKSAHMLSSQILGSIPALSSVRTDPPEGRFCCEFLSTSIDNRYGYC